MDRRLASGPVALETRAVPFPHGASWHMALEWSSNVGAAEDGCNRDE